MNHYILVYLQKPAEDERELMTAWRAMLATKLHNHGWPDAEKGRIGETAWLLDRESGASALARIVSVAESFHIPHVVRFLSSSD